MVKLQLVIIMILDNNAKFINKEVMELGALTEEEIELIDEYSKIERNYRYALRKMSAKLENLDDYCELTFKHNPIHHIESRIKTPNSILEKIKRRGHELTIDNLKTYIYDIAGLRVICNYINDIYQIVELLTRQKDIEIYVKKDYITKPKDSGYRSLHIVFYISLYIELTEIKVPVEIQFRTIAMDMWASLEHELKYKAAGRSLPEEKQKKLKEYSDELYKIDLGMQAVYISKVRGDKDND